MKFNPAQVQERVDEIRAALKQLTDKYKGDEHANLQMLGHVAEMNVVLSERAEIASQRLERLTRWLIGLTVALFILTAALLVETAYIYKDSHFNTQRDQTTNQHVIKNP